MFAVVISRIAPFYIITARRNDKTRSFSYKPRRIDTAIRDEVITHTLLHFLYINHSSLRWSGFLGNDPAPRPTVAQPTTIMYRTSQHFISCACSPYFSRSALDGNPLPKMLLESSSLEVGGVPGVIHSQEIAIDTGPFAFTPSKLASLLDSKDLSALKAIGGVEGLLKGLGTHPTHGLLIRALDYRGGHSCSQFPRTKGKGQLVELHTSASIICDHMGDRRDPYNATLQEWKQVFMMQNLHI